MLGVVLSCAGNSPVGGPDVCWELSSHAPAIVLPAALMYAGSFPPVLDLVQYWRKRGKLPAYIKAANNTITGAREGNSRLNTSAPTDLRKHDAPKCC